MNDRRTGSKKRGDGYWLALEFWPAMFRKPSRSDRSLMIANEISARQARDRRTGSNLADGPRA